MKSPLAYSSSFYFIGRKNGIERKWMMYEGEEESNKIDLLYESVTIERNGVKVIVPVKYADNGEFLNKIKEQLPYFEHVYFDVNGINNNFSIIRNELFQWSDLNTDNEMHICLDNVYYPIDYSKLGITRIMVPIGLRFSLSDGLFPIPNRESIKYTKEAKDIILAKIKLVSEYFVNKYNESIKDTDDIFKIFEYYQNDNRTIPGYRTNEKWSVRELTKFSSVKLNIPKLNNVNLLDLYRVCSIRDYLLQEYNVEHSLHKGRITALKYAQELRIYHLDEPIYIMNDVLGGIKKEYIKTIHSRANLIRKKKTIPLKTKAYPTGYNNWTTLLELKKHPKSKWRELIKEAQYIIGLMTKKFINLDTLVIPQSWLDERKKRRADAIKAGRLANKQQKLSGEITGKLASSLERYVSGKTCKLISKNINLALAHQSKLFTIFGNSNDENHLKLVNDWYPALRHGEVRFVLFSEREFKKLKGIKLHNWMEIEEFVKGEHKIFRRAATAYVISELYSEYPHVFSKRDMLQTISEDLNNKLKKLLEYREKYSLRGDENLYKSIIEVAEAKNLFDIETYVIYKEVKNILEKLPFLEIILSSIGYVSNKTPMVNVIRDLCKYHKQRIDWKNYKLVLNEEVPITEELIEELTT